MRTIPGVSIHWPAMYRKSIDQYKGVKLVEHFRHIHKNVNRWKDVGYHYIIHHDGSGVNGKWEVYDGRPDSWTGAHSATTFGNQHIGINIAYAMDDPTVPAGAINKLIELIVALDDAYKFGISEKTIHGHRRFVATECPGNKFMAMLPQVITKAKNLKETGVELPAGQNSKKKQPEEEQTGSIAIDIGNEKVKGLRVNSQAYLYVGDLKKLGFKVDYDKQSDTVIIRSK